MPRAQNDTISVQYLGWRMKHGGSNMNLLISIVLMETWMAWWDYREAQIRGVMLEASLRFLDSQCGMDDRLNRVRKNSGIK